MNAKQFAEKAIIEGMKREYEDVDDIAESLSAGLIVLTEDELRKLLTKSFLFGCDPMWHVGADETASRIMREVKGGE